jgi:cytidine deaminase
METAIQAQAHAYAPFTDYPVGAAVLAESGRIYAGCNVEPPTAIGTVCAERTAIANAIAHGERRIEAVCTVCRSAVPCGACRQWIREFSAGDIPIISVFRNHKGRVTKVVHTSIGQLLPHSFADATMASKKKP